MLDFFMMASSTSSNAEAVVSLDFALLRCSLSVGFTSFTRNASCNDCTLADLPLTCQLKMAALFSDKMGATRTPFRRLAGLVALWLRVGLELELHRGRDDVLMVSIGLQMQIESLVLFSSSWLLTSVTFCDLDAASISEVVMNLRPAKLTPPLVHVRSTLQVQTPCWQLNMLT